MSYFTLGGGFRAAISRKRAATPRNDVRLGYRLFSLFSSFDGDCQSGSFLIQRNRDKLSTRKPDVGVFTQSGPKGEVAGYSMTSSASASIVGGMSTPRALAVASGKDVAFSNSSSKCDPSQSHPSPRVGHSTKKHLACRLGLWGTCV